MPFLSECCLRGSQLTGTPRGLVQKAGDKVGDGDDETRLQLDRYFVVPSDGEVVDPKIAVVIFYDIFGFTLPNPKIIADMYADKLKVDVYVPDYLPNPAPGSYMEPSLEHYPDEKKDRGFLGSLWDKLRLLPVLPYIPGVILDSLATPRVDKALEDLKKQGYTNIVAVGYCRGGSITTYLLGKGDACPVDAGVVFHPTWDADRFPKFTKPSLWMLADVDNYVTEARRAELPKIFAANEHKPEFKSMFFKDTVHGFGCRPAADHEPTMKAFNESNDAAVAFLADKLGITVAGTGAK